MKIKEFLGYKSVEKGLVSLNIELILNKFIDAGTFGSPYYNPAA
jgi:hypothetical protein